MLGMQNVSEVRSFADHRAIVGKLIGRSPVVTTPLAECLGLVLAEDLVSPIDLPPFDNSAMDGYAISMADIVGASTEQPVILPVCADIPAGRVDVVQLAPGAAARIMTGAPVPLGADAVIPVEKTDAGIEQVTVHTEVMLGANIRRGGEDVATGTHVLMAGTVLGPAQLGLAAAVGADSLPVRRQLRILIMSTGSELTAPGQPLRHGKIYESNGIMLAAAAKMTGAETTLLRFVPDNVEAFHAMLRPHLADVDVIVTSGGVSAGAYEVVKEALSTHEVEFVRVAMQPGGPQGAGRYHGIPVITLPGNPVSAHVSFELFVRQALRVAMGHATDNRQPVTARITETMRSPNGKRQFRRGNHDPVNSTVAPIGGPGSHLISALANANCLIEVSEDVVEVQAGESVHVLPLT